MSEFMTRTQKASQQKISKQSDQSGQWLPFSPVCSHFGLSREQQGNLVFFLKDVLLVSFLGNSKAFKIHIYRQVVTTGNFNDLILVEPYSLPFNFYEILVSAAFYGFLFYKLDLIYKAWCFRWALFYFFSVVLFTRSGY